MVAVQTASVVFFNIDEDNRLILTPVLDDELSDKQIFSKRHITLLPTDFNGEDKLYFITPESIKSHITLEKANGQIHYTDDAQNNIVLELMGPKLNFSFTPNLKVAAAVEKLRALKDDPGAIKREIKAFMNGIASDYVERQTGNLDPDKYAKEWQLRSETIFSFFIEDALGIPPRQFKAAIKGTGLFNEAEFKVTTLEITDIAKQMQAESDSPR